MTISHPDNKTQKELTYSKGHVFTLQNIWYFKTQEGETIGPFRYRSEAESNLSRFMKRLEEQLSESK